MTAYEDIRASRRLVIAGAALGYLLAGAAAVLFLANLDGGVPGAAWQIPAWLVILATPPTWALWSLDRRPSLLPAATFGAVVLGVVETVGGLFLPVHLVVAILWTMAARRRPRRAIEPSDARWKRPLLAVALAVPALLMYAHLDPMCVTTAADGTTVAEVDADAAAGWRLGMSITGMSGSSSGFDTEDRTCWNDSISWWEGALGLAAAGGVAMIGLRWRSNDEMVRARREQLEGVGSMDRAD